MSEIKVSQMPEANNINDNDLLMIVQGGYNKKIPKELLGIPTKAHQINVGSDTEYRVNLLKTKNLCDVSTLQRNKWLNINGTISGSTDPNIVSAFIKVKNGKQYIFSGIPSTFTLRVCSYTNTSTNSFKTCLINNVNNIKTFTADADYIVFAIGSGDATTLNEIQLEEGETATEYTPFINNQINIDNEKYSDTINVGATEDSRSRVNVLHSKNLLDLQPLYLAINSSGTVISNANSYNVIIDTRNINTLYVKGDLTLLSDSTLRVGQFSSYPVLGVTGTRLLINQNRSIDTSSTNYVLLAFQTGEPSITTNWVNSVKSSFMIDTANDTYEPYIVPSIKVDNEEIYRKPEIGTNENGSYIKYANGLMICSGIKSFTGANFTTQNGAVYIPASSPSINFAQQFIENPVVTLTAFNRANGVYESGLSTSLVAIWPFAFSSISNVNYSIHYIAIGRWK